MGAKCYHPTPNTPKRCGMMTAEAPPAWNSFKQRCAEHWDGVTRVPPRHHTPSYDGLVDQMLGGGDPEKTGSIAYRCLHGGEGTHRVAMRCQSSLCLRCATVYVDTWVSQVSQMLHEGVIYRPIVLTMPARLRHTCYQPSQAVLSPFMRGGVQGVDDVLRRVSGTSLTGGDIVVLQPHGRHGQAPPHRPIIATSGGGAQQARPWGHLASLPYRMLRKQWQWPLLTMLRQTGQTPEMKRVVDACDTRAREGCVTNVHKGAGPSRSQSLATSLAPYVVSPPIAVRRIDRDDGQRVP